MAAYYQIRSPLSQVTDDYMDGYIAAVSAAVTSRDKMQIRRTGFGAPDLCQL